MVYLTRRERFSAAHRLFREDWSDDQNQKIFGKCANPNWHGHNYELFVTVKSEIEESTGFGIDLRLLSNLVKEKVIDKVDHKNLNLDVDFMSGKMTTTEVLVIGIWDQLVGGVKEFGSQLHCVRIAETENNSVEYYGGK